MLDCFTTKLTFFYGKLGSAKNTLQVWGPHPRPDGDQITPPIHNQLGYCGAYILLLPGCLYLCNCALRLGVIAEAPLRKFRVRRTSGNSIRLLLSLFLIVYGCSEKRGVYFETLVCSDVSPSPPEITSFTHSV